MSLSNKPIDDQIKNTFQQHEFDFDPSAWEAMNDRLDDRQKGGGSGFGNSGFNRFGLAGLLLGLLLLIVLFQYFPTSSNVESKDSKITSTSVQQGLEESSSNINVDKNPKKEYLNNASANTGSSLASNAKTDLASPPSNSADASFPPSTLSNAAANEFIKSSQSFSGNTDESSLGNASTYAGDSSIKATAGQSNQASTNSQNAMLNLSVSNNPEGSSNQNLNSTSIPSKTPEEINLPTKESLLSLKKLTAFVSLPSSEAKTIPQEESNPELHKCFSNLKKERIREPYKWYSEAQVGVYFPTFKNGITRIQPFFIERLTQQKRLYFAVKAGYNWHKSSSLEVGISYVSIPFRFQYSYLPNLNDPSLRKIENINQQIHQWNLPLTWQVKIKKDLRVNTGIGISIRSLNKNKSSDYTPPANGEELYNLTKNIYQPLIGFWETGLGYDRGQWSLDLKYQRFFTSSFKSFEYQGQEYTPLSKEWNFSLAFGYRFQKYHDPEMTVRSTIKQSNKPSAQLGFNWGLGIATGYEHFRANHNFPDILFDMDDFITPFKLGLWGNYTLRPKIRLQGEVWVQKMEMNYKLQDSRSDSEMNIPDLNKTLTINRLEIPISVHFRMRDNIRFILGLGAEFNTAKTPGPLPSSLNKDYVFILKKLPKAYRKRNGFLDLGIGYDWRQFSFDLKYRATFDHFDQIQTFNPPSQTYYYQPVFSARQHVELSLRYAFRNL